MKILKKITAPSCDLNKFCGIEATVELSSSNSYKNSPVSSGFLITKILDNSVQNNLQIAVSTTNLYYRQTYNSYAFSPFAQGGITTNGWHKIYTDGMDIIPDTTNTRNLGSSSVTWANIYTQNAVTVVSDRNAKKSIQNIDDKVLDAWAEVEQKQYKLNGDDNWSFGYIAQDIVDAFTKHGLDYKQYNIVHEEDGKFMLKYDMCAVLESALNRRYNTGVDR